MQRRSLLSLASGGVLSLAANFVEAQPKRVTILVGSAAGGQTDTFARTLAEGMQRRTGRLYIVDNRTGAGGSIAAQAMMSAPADGTTLLLITLGHVMTPHLLKQAPYNPLTDFAPVASLAQGGSLLVVNEQVPVKDFAGFVAYAKANPGKLNYGSAGIGAPQHLQTEFLQQKLGIELTHVPYRGASPATLALRGGEISVMIIDLANAEPLLKDGKARALAQAGIKLIPGYETLPQISETAPGFDGTFWMGIVAPKGTPTDVLDKLNAQINDVVGKELQPRIATAGLQPFIQTRAEFSRFVQKEDAVWSQIIKQRGITVD